MAINLLVQNTKINQQYVTDEEKEQARIRTQGYDSFVNLFVPSILNCMDVSVVVSIVSALTLTTVAGSIYNLGCVTRTFVYTITMLGYRPTISVTSRKHIEQNLHRSSRVPMPACVVASAITV